MYERPHHQIIHKLLGYFNRDLLEEADCYFGGGTAIVLALNEYRVSDDIDFLCASKAGYSLLRNSVNQHNLGDLLVCPVKHLREVVSDRYGIRARVEVDGVPVKIELVKEERIDIERDPNPLFCVPTLARDDMYAQKLLANTDRWVDKAVRSRDIIDLAKMISHWGDIPESAWKKVIDTYGNSAIISFEAATRQMISNDDHAIDCLKKMHMNASDLPSIREALLSQSLPAIQPKTPLTINRSAIASMENNISVTKNSDPSP